MVRIWIGFGLHGWVYLGFSFQVLTPWLLLHLFMFNFLGSAKQHDKPLDSNLPCFPPHHRPTLPLAWAKRCTARRHRIRREQHDGVQRARRVGSCSGCLLGCKYATVGEISLLPESCNTLPSSCYIWLMEWNINIHWHHWWMYLGRQLKKCCLQNNLYMGQQLKFVKKNLKKLFFFFCISKFVTYDYSFFSFHKI